MVEALVMFIIVIVGIGFTTTICLMTNLMKSYMGNGIQISYVRTARQKGECTQRQSTRKLESAVQKHLPQC